MEFKGKLDKKNALGMWTTKFVKLVGTEFTVSDSENGAPIFKSNLTGVTRGVGIDVTAMTFFGDQKDQSIVLRGATGKDSSYWYNVCYGAMEAARKVKPRQAGLPARDPRFDLPIVSVPDEFACSFLNLEKAVLYWFGAVTKYGQAGTFKSGNEDRIIFVGDKAVYVTKPNSEVTRCMKIEELKCICTSVGCGTPPGGDKDHYLVFKMDPPEFDLYVSGPNLSNLVAAVTCIYKYLNKGLKELPVKSIKLASDPAVSPQLQRPKELKQIVIKPVMKEQLKAALDAFGAKHGIVFEGAPNNYGGVVTSGATASAATFTTQSQNNLANAAPAGDAGSSSAPAPSGGSTAPANKIPATDALGCFLIKIGLEKYYQSLFNQSIDLEVLECMDTTDMKSLGGLKDDADVELMKKKLSDAAFMAEVKADVEAAQKNANWQPKKDPEAQKEEVKKEEAPAPAPAPKKAPINFFDDSDDDLLNIPAKAAVAKEVNGKAAITFDDSDDDLLPPPKKAAPKKAPIDFDDDDI